MASEKKNIKETEDRCRGTGVSCLFSISLECLKQPFSGFRGKIDPDVNNCHVFVETYISILVDIYSHLR